MSRWSRNPNAVIALSDLALSAEEGFVLSRLDEPLGRDELMSLTGLPGERIDNILAFLEDKGLAISDTPSMLLAHVSRQPLVQRDSQLRNLLHRHPNMPAEAKRRGK